MILHPAKHLTDNYKKDSESNNYKLLSIGHLEHLEILESLNKIEVSRDIDMATGFNLDKAGKNVLELRDGRDDETFRQAIKIKIISNLSAGTIEDINAVAAILFGESFISVQETWNMEEHNYEPAALILSITDNPEAQERFLYYMKAILRAVKAGGVRLYNSIFTEISSSTIYTGTTAFDCQCMTIPAKIIKNQDIPSIVYFRGCVLSSYSLTKIPTKALRGEI